MTEPFLYPAAPHVRRHGPRGYADYESYRPWLRDEYAFRCVYCLIREMWGSYQGVYNLDHFLPVATRPDLVLEYDNLLYCCISCNLSKGKLATPDPLTTLLDADVKVSAGGEIQATTAPARKLVELLGLNRPRLREFPELWIRVVYMARLHDPTLFQQLMRYPPMLPYLSRLRPPAGNARADGISQAHFARRQRGELSDTY